jgi:hypothetical protein
MIVTVVVLTVPVEVVVEVIEDRSSDGHFVVNEGLN